MKILHVVEWYYPSVGGMQEVARQLSERLAASGHEVCVATRSYRGAKAIEERNGVNIHRFEISGNLATGITAAEGEEERLLAFAKNGEFDVMTIFAAKQALCDVILPQLEFIPCKKVFVPTGFSNLQNPDYSAYFERMKEWMKQFDMNVFLSLSYQDYNFAKDAGVVRVMLIPNGAAEEEFEAPLMNIREKLKIDADKVVVLHVGSYTGIKGHKEALRMFLDAKTPNAVLLMCGNGNEKLKEHFYKHHRFLKLRLKAMMKRKKIFFESLSRQETVSAFRESDIFLFPSNLECSPIVLFEAMAAGIPFICSEAGNSAEIVKWSNGGMVIPSFKDGKGYTSPDINAGAELLELLTTDEEKRKLLGSLGQKAWKEKYTWQKIAAQYESLYKLVSGYDNS